MWILMAVCLTLILASGSNSIYAFSSQFPPSLLNRHIADADGTITVATAIITPQRSTPRHSHRYQHDRASSKINGNNGDDNDVLTETDNDGGKEEVQMTEEEMAEMIEVSFVQACLQLAKGYVDVQKLFLAAVKVNYDRRIPLSNLVRNVHGCPVRSANRELTDEEVDVRTTSMALVYLTHGIVETYGGTVEEKVREGLGMGPVSSPSLDSGDPLQDALKVHYGTAVIGLTLTVVNEEEACDGDGMKARQARPPIPGTS